MAEEKKNRLLCILQYLWEWADEDHPVTITDIQNHLEYQGFLTHRKTIPGDLAQLQEFGIDIVCNKSNKNLYLIGERLFELPELKLLIDAVHACRFISEKKSDTLVSKLAMLASNHQAAELCRDLVMENRVKTDNREVYYTIDLLHTAINEKKQLYFQYFVYLPTKEKALKHDGKVYEFSPYSLVWNNDSYYAIGHSVSHGKVVKFRVDRIHAPMLAEVEALSPPEDFDAAVYIRKVFQMYDEQIFTVKLLCENGLMNSVIDHFSENVRTEIVDEDHFIAVVEVSVSPTFLAWVFTFGGSMRILSPQTVKEKYIEMAKAAIDA